MTHRLAAALCVSLGLWLAHCGDEAEGPPPLPPDALPLAGE